MSTEPQAGAHERQPCTLCGGSDFEHLYTTQGRFYSFNRVKATFMLCVHCGLTLRHPRPTTTGRFYELEYWDSKPDAPRYCSLNKSKAQIAAVRNALGSPVWDEGTLVDVGCGVGNLVGALAEEFQGCQIVGVEPSSAIARSLEANKPTDRITILHGDLESYAATNPVGVRALFMMSVLEHLVDPAEGLLQIRKILGADGVLVVQVPDLDHPGPLGPEYFFRDFHLYYYTEATLVALLSRHGFRVVQRLSEPCFRGSGVPFLSLVARRDDSIQPIGSRSETERIRASVQRATQDARIRAPVLYAMRHWVRAPARRMFARYRSRARELLKPQGKMGERPTRRQ
jgi:SAM-dependent methyltransferase